MSTGTKHRAKGDNNISGKYFAITFFVSYFRLRFKQIPFHMEWGGGYFYSEFHSTNVFFATENVSEKRQLPVLE
jgi:hypothetical protein